MPGMGRINFDEYASRYKPMARRMWLAAEGARKGSRRNIRRRPRSAEESKILTCLARARLNRARLTGELIMLGPRRYRLRVFE